MTLFIIYNSQCQQLQNIFNFLDVITVLRAIYRDSLKLEPNGAKAYLSPVYQLYCLSC